MAVGTSVTELQSALSQGGLDPFYGQLNAHKSGSDAIALRELESHGKADIAGATTNGSSFSQILRDSIDKVNQYQVEADQSIKELVAGRNKNIHETLLAVERADSSLKMMMQVRNKVLDAYKEIIKMQV